MIIQGTTDIQVSVDDAKRLAAANPHAKLLIVEGMNHILKSVSSDKSKQMASYGDRTLMLAPDLLMNIVDFVGRKAGKQEDWGMSEAKEDPWARYDRMKLPPERVAELRAELQRRIDKVARWSQGQTLGCPHRSGLHRQRHRPHHPRRRLPPLPARRSQARVASARFCIHTMTP